MAYNYFPNYYNSPYLQMPSVPNMQTPTPAPAAAPQQGVRNSDFVLVQSEDEARSYPVAFGNTVTFKNENMPYMYTKTMGMSQLDRPVFEKYKLVKETAVDAPESAKTAKDDNGVMEKLRGEIEAIWSEINALKKKSNVKKVLDDESA